MHLKLYPGDNGFKRPIGVAGMSSMKGDKEDLGDKIYAIIINYY